MWKIGVGVLLVVLLASCGSSITEEQARERAEVLFATLASEGHDDVYDTYGSEEWKEDVSAEAFGQNMDGIEPETFAVENVRESDDQWIVDGQVDFATYTADVRLILSGKEEIVSLEFRSAVARLDFPDGISEEPITIGEGTDFPLEGKLTVPANLTDRVPAVVLVHGSGPADEDESVYAYKPFRDLAWGLAERGIATIRYDKRTFVYGNDAFSEGAGKINVQEETIDDALLAVDVLVDDERIDAGQIYIGGHSLGGMLAPRIAAASADVAGIISLAGSPRPLEEIILDQQEAVLEGQAFPEDIHKQQMAEIEQMREIVEELMTLSEEEILSEQLFGLPAYYFWEMQQYPVEEIVNTLGIPIYIMQGDADFQVYKDRDYVAWQELLADIPDVAFSTYPNLNHFFVEVDEDAGEWTESYEVPGLVAEEVIDDVASWIDEQVDK